MPTKCEIRIWLCVLLAASAGPRCRGDTVIDAPTPGPTETNSLYPLLIKQAGLTNPPSMRYQQVYNSTLFTNLDSTNITTLRFYLEFLTNRTLVNWTVPMMQINLSTTSKSADGLSPVFLENVGPDNTVVFGPGSYSFRGNAPDTAMGVTLERSFRYNPALGNLLVDIRIFDGSGPIDPNGPALEAFNSPTDEVSRVWSTNVNASAADGVDTTGLTTHFLLSPDAFITVPSPRAAETFTVFPFLIRQTYNFGPTNYTVSMRYQQVYSSNLFEGLDPSLVYLTSLTFFLESQLYPGSGFGWLVKNMQINLSTTPKGPSDLSTIFSQNVGADDTIVLGPRTNGFSGSTPDGPMTVYLDRPFRYNPAHGNILMDVRITDQTGPFLYDMFFADLAAFNSPTGLVSRVWSTNVTASAADGVDGTGLTTVFQFDGIPSLRSAFLPVAYGSGISNVIHIKWPSQPSIFQLQRADQAALNQVWQSVTNQLGGGALGGGWFIDVPTATSPPHGVYRLVWPTGH
jgi:hypothetical protein